MTSSAELFERLVALRASPAPTAERDAAAREEAGLRAELEAREDVVDVLCRAMHIGRGSTAALARHDRVIRSGLVADVLLAIGSERACEAFFGLTEQTDEEARVGVLRALQRAKLPAATLDRLLDARVPTTILRRLLGRLGADAPRHADRLCALARARGLEPMLDHALAAAGPVARGALLERALASPTRGSASVGALLATFDPARAGELRGVLERAPDPWSIVEELVAVLLEDDEAGLLDGAFSEGEGRGAWASPFELVERIAHWTLPKDNAGTRAQVVASTGGFRVLGGGDGGLRPIYGSSLGRALVRRPPGRGLRRALHQTFVLWGAPLYHVACSRWDAGDALHRVARTSASPSSPPEPLDARRDGAWHVRNAGALARLRSGDYAVWSARLDLARREEPPFGELARHDDDGDVAEAAPIQHFAGPRATAQTTSQTVLLPSGVHPKAAPVAYVWRAPEELAMEAHGEAPPEGRTRMLGVLLQGEATLADGAREVVLITPRAWGDDEDRLRAATD